MPVNQVNELANRKDNHLSLGKQSSARTNDLQIDSQMLYKTITGDRLQRLLHVYQHGYFAKKTSKYWTV